MTSQCCDLTTIDEWLKQAKPNNKLIYYTGQSIQDTIISREVGKQVYKYAVEGLVYLTQYRSSGYYFDFDHFMIKASKPPVYSLVPFADNKTEELRRQRELRSRKSHGKDKGTSEEKREREWNYPVR